MGVGKLQFLRSISAWEKTCDCYRSIENLEDYRHTFTKGTIGELDEVRNGLLCCIRVLEINLRVCVVNPSDRHALCASQIPRYGLIRFALTNELLNLFPRDGPDLLDEICRNKVPYYRDNLPNGLQELIATVVERLGKVELAFQQLSFLARGIRDFTHQLAVLFHSRHSHVGRRGFGGLQLVESGWFRIVSAVEAEIVGTGFPLDLIESVVTGIVGIDEVAVFVKDGAIDVHLVRPGLLMNKGGVFKRLHCKCLRCNDDGRESGYGHRSGDNTGGNRAHGSSSLIINEELLTATQLRDEFRTRPQYRPLKLISTLEQLLPLSGNLNHMRHNTSSQCLHSECGYR